MAATIHFGLLLNNASSQLFEKRYIAWEEKGFAIQQSKDALQHFHYSYQKGKRRKNSIYSESSSLLTQNFPYFSNGQVI